MLTKDARDILRTGLPSSRPITALRKELTGERVVATIGCLDRSNIGAPVCRQLLRDGEWVVEDDIPHTGS